MGKFNWRRAVRAVGTGGLSEAVRATGVDLNPGPNGNDPAMSVYPQQPGQQTYDNKGIEIFGGLNPEFEAWQQRRDPYGPDVQWDPSTGAPMNQRLPRLENAIDWQYLANQHAAQRRNALWGDAQGSIGQGIDLLQSYRPGGSAALASGMFGQRAGLFAAQAQDTEAPDMLMGFRQQKQLEADKEAKRANRFAQILGGVQAVTNMVGAVTGGGPGQNPAPPVASQTQAPQQPGPYASGYQFPQTQTPMQASAGQPGPFQGGYGPQTAQAGMAPSGGAQGGPGASGAVQAGGYGEVRGARGGAGGPGTAQARMGGGGGAQGGMGTGMVGDAPMSTFMPEEAAAVAMASTPGTGSNVYPEWAKDPYRQYSVNNMVRSASICVQRAMAIA